MMVYFGQILLHDVCSPGYHMYMFMFAVRPPETSSSPLSFLRIHSAVICSDLDSILSSSKRKKLAPRLVGYDG